MRNCQTEDVAVYCCQINDIFSSKRFKNIMNSFTRLDRFKNGNKAANVFISP